MAMIRDWSDVIGGRTAMVTGAGAGVGRAIAIQMARAGATVWVNDLHLERAAKVVAEIEAEGLKAKPVAGDVTELDSVHEMRDVTGPVDILVNNAGSGVRAYGEGKAEMIPFVETKPENWDPIMRVNLAGVLYMSHTFLPGMLERQWGRILTIISDAGRKGERGHVVYGAAKAAAAGFTRGLATEVGRSGITVNCIALGSIRHGDMARNLDSNPEREHTLIRPYPMGRLGKVDEIAALAVYLASDESGFTTGTAQVIDGGWSN